LPPRDDYPVFANQNAGPEFAAGDWQELVYSIGLGNSFHSPTTKTLRANLAK